MRKVKVTGPARRDIARALRRSGEDFGAAARTRYRGLFDQALQALGDDPLRVGVRAIDDVRKGYFTYHLQSCLRANRSPAVKKPRHLIAFFVDDAGDVVVARVFHERQLLEKYFVEDN